MQVFKAIVFLDKWYEKVAKIYLNYLPASDIYLVFVTGYSAPYRLFVNDGDTTCLFEETPTIAAGFEHSYELKYNFNSGDEFSIKNTTNGYFIEGTAPANAVEIESNNAYVENGGVSNFFKIYDGGEDIYIFLNTKIFIISSLQTIYINFLKYF